jgi:GT2 family glycosyltransferase
VPVTPSNGSESGSDLPAPASLSVGIVTFEPDLILLKQTVESLAASITEAERSLLLKGSSVTLIDNTGRRESMNAVRHAVGRALDDAAVETRFRSDHGNIGYGAAHNLALLESASDYHLVLNPDVVLDPPAISEALRFLQTHPEVGLLTPAVTGPDGAPQFLAKRFPNVFDLALRGLGSPRLSERFRHRLDRYVHRERGIDTPAEDLEVASGCFMLLRRELAQSIGGFDRRYFLYFEDFDLAVRMRGAGARIAYVPQVRIVHFGGGAARKGWRHVAMYVASGCRFFGRHGWRLR